MKTLEVSLIVQSPLHTVEQLSSILGRPPSLGSRDTGVPGIKAHLQAASSQMLWRFDSGVDKHAPLVEQLEDLNRKLPPSDLAQLLPSDCTVFVDVAVFFDTPMSSLTFPRRAIEIIESYSAALEVTSYPSDFGETN